MTEQFDWDSTATTATTYDMERVERAKTYSFAVPDISSDTQHEIANACVQFARLLLLKNARYKNSALDPIRIFAKSDADEQLRVRIDDKINRYLNQDDGEDEDVLGDTIGYLILLWIKEQRKKNKQQVSP